MEFYDLIYEKRDHVAYITINRPQVMNATSPVTQDELMAACDDLEDDPDVWVGVIAGAGEKAFCAGHDMKWEDSHPEEQQRWLERRKRSRRQVFGHLRPTATCLRPEMWKPLIAAVKGYCLGGGLEIALCCDIIVAADSATFGLPEVCHGWPPGSAVFTLPRRIPHHAAMEMLMFGDRISARRAYELGLVNRVVPAAEVMDTAAALARRLCQNPPLAVRAVKELTLRGLEMPLNYPPMAWHLFSDPVNRQVEESSDKDEGRKAFAEKRKPVFKGR